MNNNNKLLIKNFQNAIKNQRETKVLYPKLLINKYSNQTKIQIEKL